MNFACMSLAIMIAVANVDLNQLLDERLELNKKYKKEFVEAAADSRYAKQLTKYEAGVADAWIDLIEYAKKSDDEKLKKIVLKMEYYDELRSYTFDLEYSETPEDRRESQKGLVTYAKKLASIE